MVQGLADACELQGGLQREATYDGLRVAEAKGNGGGHGTAVVDLMPDHSAADHQATSATGSRHVRYAGQVRRVPPRDRAGRRRVGHSTAAPAVHCQAV
ncbi:hypothetical protein [Streptomyces sp. NBC_00038]|uniref:hypothetical protein n=1 Tax=Streptomyces sp. NBC_00038 TaxID=2903615 RepID=UPI002252216E|nr:hypothetical protein [Streptomyces sp. NBC_00038]MCX5562936.1 hypothetical protein [Streptomyces sp. NBC_00038]